MKILLICSGGMSTSLIVEAMKKFSVEKGIYALIESAGSESLEDKINEFDVILVAPQVRHRFDRFKEIADRFNKPIELIDARAYGLVDGRSIFERAASLL
ncbi:MAG: PTS sugar transporter subunit IIB [Firmicutes bacterium]|nr:PTS sugar transporter subunit IIB [Bacillota bacterium]